MYNGTVKWCSITPSLCILLSATLPGDFPTHFQKKKTPHKERTFFPLITLNDAQQRSTIVKSAPPFHLRVVNFELFTVSMCSPRQRGEALDKGSFVPLLWGRARAQWRFSLLSDITLPGLLWGPFTHQNQPARSEAAFPSADSVFQRRFKAKRFRCTMWN